MDPPIPIPPNPMEIKAIKRPFIQRKKVDVTAKTAKIINEICHKPHLFLNFIHKGKVNIPTRNVAKSNTPIIIEFSSATLSTYVA